MPFHMLMRTNASRLVAFRRAACKFKAKEKYLQINLHDGYGYDPVSRSFCAKGPVWALSYAVSVCTRAALSTAGDMTYYNMYSVYDCIQYSQTRCTLIVN